jgi:hypothetical protein
LTAKGTPEGSCTTGWSLYGAHSKRAEAIPKPPVQPNYPDSRHSVSHTRPSNSTVNDACGSNCPYLVEILLHLPCPSFQKSLFLSKLRGMLNAFAKSRASSSLALRSGIQSSLRTPRVSRTLIVLRYKLRSTLETDGIPDNYTHHVSQGQLSASG